MDDYDYTPYFRSKRKDWESNYDPKFQSPSRAKELHTAASSLSSLPSNRWVRPRLPEGSETLGKEFLADLKRWFSEHKIKHRSCLITENSETFWVYIFKKPSDAVLFKLAWG